MGVTPFVLPDPDAPASDQCLWIAAPSTFTGEFVRQRMLTPKLQRELDRHRRHPADRMPAQRATLLRSLDRLVSRQQLTVETLRDDLDLIVRSLAGERAPRVRVDQLHAWIWLAALAGAADSQVDWLQLLVDAIEDDDISLWWLDQQSHANDVCTLVIAWADTALRALARPPRPAIEHALATLDVVHRLVAAGDHPPALFAHRLAGGNQLDALADLLVAESHRLSQREAIPTWGRKLLARVEHAAALKSGDPLIVVAPGAVGKAGHTPEMFARLASPLPLRRIAAPLGLRQRLTDESPWLAAAIADLVAPIELAAAAGRTPTGRAPCLLIGPPGSGKSHLAQGFAASAGLPSRVLSIAGSSDNRSLHGTARGWGTATPSFPLTVIAGERVANPVIVLDELDKAAPRGHNGSVIDTLHMLLEPATARRWLDECLEVECDLSKVTFVCTANSLAGLPSSLLSRLQLIYCPEPRPADFDAIVERVCRSVLAEVGLHERWLPIVAAAIRRPRSMQQFSVRDVQQQVYRALADAPAATLAH